WADFPTNSGPGGTAEDLVVLKTATKPPPELRRCSAASAPCLPSAYRDSSTRQYLLDHYGSSEHVDPPHKTDFAHGLGRQAATTNTRMFVMAHQTSRTETHAFLQDRSDPA